MGSFLNIGALFELTRFFLITSDSHGTLHLAFSLVGMHSAAAYIWAVTKFSYSSFSVYASDVSWRTSDFFSYSSHISIVYISVVKWGPVKTYRLWLFISYFCIDSGISLPRRFFNTRYSIKRGVCITVLFIHFLFMSMQYSCAFEVFFRSEWGHNFPSLFWNSCWDIKDCPRVKNIQDIPYFFGGNCVSKIYYFHLRLFNHSVSSPDN